MILRIVFLCLISTPALAGPWIRTPGDQFLSITTEVQKQDGFINSYNAVYYEYGLSNHLTLGLDAGADLFGYQSTLAYARTPVWRGPHGVRVSAELGLGGMQDSAGRWAVVRPGLSLGQGFAFWKGGWWALDATYSYRPEDRRGVAKVDSIMGLNYGDRYKVMLQVVAEKPTGADASLSATPGVAIRFAPGMHLVAGVVTYTDRPTSLKFGIWTEF